MKYSKTDNELVQECIEHWKRMIDYAKKKSSLEFVNFFYMRSELNEVPSYDDCPLCRKYRRPPQFICSLKCPLKRQFAECGHFENHYPLASECKTWGVWVEKAELFLKQLKSLLPEEVK